MLMISRTAMVKEAVVNAPTSRECVGQFYFPLT